MQIRKAQISDLEQITDILNQAIRWGKATAILKEYKPEDRIEWFNENNSEKYCIYVAEAEGSILGYLSLTPYRKGRQAFLHLAEVSYFVDFEQQGKGIASVLMEKAFEHCREYEITSLIAFLMSHNDPSVQFLKKFGFELWGLFPKTLAIGGEEFDHAIYGKRLE